LRAHRRQTFKLSNDPLFVDNGAAVSAYGARVSVLGAPSRGIAILKVTGVSTSALTASVMIDHGIGVLAHGTGVIDHAL
jgi:hypothetical protein